MSNWISVKEMLPELEKNVLLFDYWKSVSGEQMEDIRVGYLREFVTRKSSSGLVTTEEWGGTEFAFNITHWMPLPEPPSEPTITQKDDCCGRCDNINDFCIRLDEDYQP